MPVGYIRVGKNWPIEPLFEFSREMPFRMFQLFIKINNLMIAPVTNI